MQGEWPLIGRQGELQRLRAVVLGRKRSGAVIAGAAGVGKSRLALECLRAVEGAGFATARATATRAAAGLPFGALAPLLPPQGRDRSLATEGRAGLLRRSAAAIVEQAGGRPLVILVDDAQFLDDPSAALVHQLAMTNAAFVLTTIRSGGPAPEPVLSLWKDGLVEWIELDGLDGEAVEELLAAVLGGPVDPWTAGVLFGRCEGNVLFLRELVLGALHDGSLCNDGGIWRLVRALSPSPRLVSLVEARLGRLDETERRLLEVVSLGEPLGPAELGTVADLGLVEDLVDKGLLVSRMESRRVEVRVAHPLYGEVLRAETPALRIPAITRALAGAVEATGARRREDTLRVATWSMQSGTPRPGLMLEAATIARWRYDFPLAERLARAAVADGAGFEASLLAAQLAALQGRAEEALDEFAELADEADTDARRGIVAVGRVDTLAFYLGRMHEGLRLAEQAEAAIADPVWRDEVTARRAVILYAIEGPRAGADVAVPLVSRARGRALVWACMISSFSLGRQGAIEAAREMARRGAAEHERLQQPMEWYPWIHRWLECEALGYAGRFAEAEDLARREYEQGVSEASAEARSFFAWHLATFVGDRGHVRSATRWAREGIALNRELGRAHYVGECLIGLATALALAGRADEAAGALADFDALGIPNLMFKPVEHTLARGWVAVAAGDLPDGVRHFAAAAERATAGGDRAGATAALHALARIGHADRALPELQALVAAMEGELPGARLAHVRALVNQDLAGLAQISASFEAMGADLLAAEAAADAAVAWRRDGQARKAAGLERRGRELAERAEFPVTPALQALEARAQLTPSERRVAVMAAAGRLNREIAEQLGVSVRTVENHLQRAYEKLGITGRSELRAVFGDPEAQATMAWPS